MAEALWGTRVSLHTVFIRVILISREFRCVAAPEYG
jgi:hypothetical protein